MKRCLFLLAILAASLVHSPTGSAGNEKPNGTKVAIDPERSMIGFVAGSFGFGTVTGQFHEISGWIDLPTAAPTSLTATATIGVHSIDTGWGLRDRVLKGKNFFDADDYPRMHFEALAVTQRQDTLTMTGRFGLHGVTNTLTFPFTLSPTNAAASDRPPTIRATFELNRQDYGVGSDTFKDRLVDDMITIRLRLTGKPPRSEAPNP